jgi:hypothetical protein
MPLSRKKRSAEQQDARRNRTQHFDLLRIPYGRNSRRARCPTCCCVPPLRSQKRAGRCSPHRGAPSLYRKHPAVNASEIARNPSDLPLQFRHDRTTQASPFR